MARRKKRMHRGGPIKKQNRGLLAAAAVLIAVVLLLFALRWRNEGFDWKLFYGTLLRVRWPWLAASILVALATYYGRALRWEVMVRPINPNPSLWNLFSATAIGFTGIVLFGRAGELIRPYLISVKERVSFSSQMAAWVIERLCDLLAALLLFAFALVQVGRSGAEIGGGFEWVLKTGGYLAALLGGVCVLLLILISRSSETVRQRLISALAFLPESWRGKSEELVDSFVAGAECTKCWSSLVWLIAYTALEWILILLCYVTLFRAFPAVDGLGLRDAMIFTGFVAFGSLIQIPGVGGGVQLVSVVVLTEVFHLPLASASGLALVTWIVTFVAIVPVGLLLSLHEGLNWRKLKEIQGGSRV
jgi:uncharacterized protein (TIRG00374 family)